MAPTNADLLNEIEELKEMIPQMDPQVQYQKDDLIFINHLMILINQVRTKTLRVLYVFVS
jgi:hypothetical protein